MLVAIVADIHGNYRALQAVLIDIESFSDVREIVSLGDNVGYGPEPEKVIAALRQYKVASVMGNHELGLISVNYFKRMNQIPRESLSITRSLLDRDSLHWLRDLPAVMVRHGARFVHGCPPQSMTTYLFSPSGNRLQRLFSIYPEQVCFSGHTHTLEWFRLCKNKIAKEKMKPGQVILDNTCRHLILSGSVGQPRDMVNRMAKYCLWDTEAHTLEIRAVKYDVKTTIRLLKERGFHAFNANRLR